MQGKRTANRRAAALRQALMLSISSMLVCAMMLVGMTYAWFTDSAVTAVNAIHTGTVNADLMYKTSDGTYRRLAQNTSLFADTTTPWVPGHIEIKYLKIENNGTLPIRYSLGVNASMSKTNSQGETLLAKDETLLAKLRFAFIPLPNSTETITLSTDCSTYTFASISSSSQSIIYTPLSNTYSNSSANKLGTLTSSGTDGSTAAYYAFILYYPSESTGNYSNNQDVLIGLRLLAIQQKNTEAFQVTDSSKDSNPWTDAADSTKTTNSLPQSETTGTTTSNSAETSEN